MTDVVVLGSGVAGLTAALALDRAGLSVTVLTKAELVASATRYAQGGVAAALSPPDSPELHFSDTVSAGGGLCDPEAVRVLVGEGPARLRELIALGASFDRVTTPGLPLDGPEAGGAGRNGDGVGPYALAREGGHSLARVLHAGGDATGFEVERALVAAVTASGVEAREGWLATGLVVTGGRVAGVAAVDPAGRPAELAATHVVLASGGAGQLFAVTTNPALSTGDGVAMALRAGAAVTDLEFVQFHPTALAHPGMPRPLLSEALRGEGALLRDDRGVAFMAADHPLGDLAPRDVVARAITRRLVDRGLDHLWLDATGIDGFDARFPTISRACRSVGLDATRDWLPVAPAAHYLCGGVVTDLDGAASLPGLWACGEVACTGVHGANRLASNSLLEGLVFGHRVARAIVAGRDGPEPTGALRGVPLDTFTTRRSSEREKRPEERQIEEGLRTRRSSVVHDTTHERQMEEGLRTRRSSVVHDTTDERQMEEGLRIGRSSVVHHTTHERQIDPAGLRSRLQQVMTAHVGVLRDAAGLQRAAGELQAVEAEAAGEPDTEGLAGAAGLRALHELRSLATVGRALAAAAADREESRGAHHRLDHPEPAREVERVVHLGDGTRIRVPASLARELER